MSMNSVPASAGIDWLVGAASLAKRWPLVFPVMGLIIALIGLIPFLGGLVTLILGPALIGGTVAAAHTANRGGAPSAGQLFQGFQQSDRVGALVALCIPTVVALLVAAALVFVFAIGAFISGALANAQALLDNPQAIWAAFGGGLLLLIPLLVALLLAAYAFTYFAIPRCMLGSIEAFPAMGESWRAARANAGAFAVSCIVLLVGSWVLLYVLSLLHLGRIGDLLTSAAVYTVLGPMLYFGTRAVFGDATHMPTAADSTTPATPPPPPAA
ncbi:MAG TPA: hypothetical protein VFN09_03200 [Rhodanobacteraceae bacterium]|nr:hypothetical protein [Rhodanobacteraceae bacterium]